MDATALGKLLLGVGLALLAAGALLLLLGRFPGLPIGRLPGDIHVERGGFRFSFPIVTCLILSIVLTLVFRLFRR